MRPTIPASLCPRKIKTLYRHITGSASAQFSQTNFEKKAAGSTRISDEACEAFQKSTSRNSKDHEDELKKPGDWAIEKIKLDKYLVTKGFKPDWIDSIHERCLKGFLPTQ